MINLSLHSWSCNMARHCTLVTVVFSSLIWLSAELLQLCLVQLSAWQCQHLCYYHQNSTLHHAINSNAGLLPQYVSTVAPDPEVGCTIELFVLAATQEKEQQKVVDTVQEVLFPASNNTVNNTTNGEKSLPLVYNSLTVEFGENASDSGYSKFVEAINEITEAKQEACYGALDGRPSVDDVPRLVQEFRTALRTTQKDLLKLRTIFGQMLCIKDQTGRSDSMGRKRRQTPVFPVCRVIPKPCYERTPEECTCPPGGIDGDCILCSCEFFRCLDPEDVLKPVFGFVEYDITTMFEHDSIA